MFEHLQLTTAPAQLYDENVKLDEEQNREMKRRKKNGIGRRKPI